MKITVIGCGRWGSLIAWYLNTRGHEVTLYGRASSAKMQRFLLERKNDLLELPESITLSTELSCADDAEVIIISIGAQQLRSLLASLAQRQLHGKIFTLCMKGIECETGKRLTEIVKEILPEDNAVSVWVGPGHVQEFYVGHPSCMVIDSDNDEVKRRLVQEFSGPLIRFYYGEDLIGSEIGAAAKNVIGIAAGMLDGMGLSTLKGALMARAPAEIAHLISTLGGNWRSAYGLCHLGDYEATLFSPHSHNRAFGEAFVKGEKFGSLAEGYATCAAITKLAADHGVELPICESVYHILYEGADPKQALNSLLTRSLKQEFDRGCSQ